MKLTGLLTALLLLCATAHVAAQQVVSWIDDQSKVTVTTTQGTLHLIPLSDAAIRVKFAKKDSLLLPDWVYIKQSHTPRYKLKERGEVLLLTMSGLVVEINKATGNITYKDIAGKQLLAEERRSLSESSIQELDTYCAEQVFSSPDDEYLYGLGQFQDGYLNIRGLSRRLTQVNTQISIPFVLSNKGYGVLWNNYGLTEFNPSDLKVEMQRTDKQGKQTLVDVTSTEGGKKEVRKNNSYAATFTVKEKGQYAVLLDVGQKMARRHHLVIDGNTIFEVDNVWLPPTSSALIELDEGVHTLHAELTQNDAPVFYWKKVEEKTTFRSPVAQSVDYTLFAGAPQQVIAGYRQLTGQAPLLPRWALGYIHCRERFHSQEELLNTAQRFRDEKIPVDVIVQDWQYWGKYGWNAMRFDEANYPDPALMVSKLHQMNLRLMLSVWSKIDPVSELGKVATSHRYYIPHTQWIDFFNPEAADFYWQHFSNRLLKPYQIDAWWQDATEPENDDLQGRRVMNGTLPAEIVRNVYPLLVNKTVYEGLRKDDPQRRAMILTRSGFPGIQRYGAATWSGDVGNDWETLRRQITGGLGMMASGLPWWTYDAGGFFRPGDSQYTDKGYHERFLRWLQTSTFLPLMRVHGYMSNTEFWNYGDELMRIARLALDLRYRLLPYIYSEAAAVTFEGSTLMRPLVMDFPTDAKALEQKYQFMFGKSLLIAPVLEPNCTTWSVYLPSHQGGWYDFWTGEKYDGGQVIDLPVSLEHIPVFVKAGTLLPLGSASQHTEESVGQPIEIRVYPGTDGTFTLYQDEGTNYNYEDGRYATIDLSWNNKAHQLTVATRQGTFLGMNQEQAIEVVKVTTQNGVGIPNNGNGQKALYKGKRLVVKL